MNNSIQPLLEQVSKGIIRLSPKVFPDLYEKFYKNLDVTLQKNGSNAMTKTIRKLMESKKLYIGWGATTIDSISVIPVFGVFIAQDALLHGIIADIVKCSPDSSKLIVESLEKIKKMQQEISSLEKFLNDENIEKIAELKDKIKKEEEILAGSIDYQRIYEAYYFIFLRFLVKKIDQGHSYAMFETALELYKKLILKVFGSYLQLEDDVRIVFDAIVDYVFTRSFTIMPHPIIIKNISKRYGDKVAQYLESIYIKKVDSLDKIADAFNAAKIVRIPRMTWNSQLAKVIGDQGIYILYSTYDYYISWLVLSLHNPVLFRPVIIDKNLQSKLETILLNYKSKAKY